MTAKHQKRERTLTVVSGAEATSDDDGQLWNIHTRNCADHFGAVLGDSTSLCFGADHVPSNIYEKEQRDLALRTQLDEMRRLECRRREQYAVVRDNTHGEAVDVCKPLKLYY